MQNGAAWGISSASSLMRLRSICLCAFALSLALASSGAEEKTAFDAVRLLTAEQQAALAIIAARGGTPEPERWHLLAHEAGSETGLREFVVAKGKIVASRNVSQFAESLAPGNVFAPESLKVDSDRVVRVARDFAKANRVSLASVHFDLRRNGPDGAALWTAICLNIRGEELGRLVLNATTPGMVISHTGFSRAPDSEKEETPPAVTERRGKSRPHASNTRRRPPLTGAPQPRQIPQPPPPARGGFFDRVFGGTR